MHRNVVENTQQSDAEHQARQYIYCDHCKAKMNIEDLRKNQCASCGTQLMKEKKSEQ